MVRRFLEYSLIHARPIRIVLFSSMKCRSVIVTALSEDTAEIRKNMKSPVEKIAISDILSASYGRGDDGDTLKYTLPEEERSDGKHGEKQ